MLGVSLLWTLPIAVLGVLALSPGFVSFLLSNPDPLSWQTGPSLVRHLVVEPLGALLFFLGAGGLGGWILNRWIPSDLGREVRLLFGLPVGLGAVSFFILFCGLGGMLGPGLSWTVFGVLAVWGVLEAARFRFSIPRLDPPSFVLAVLAVACYLAALVGASAPATDWDCLAYHLAVPKIYLQAGRVFEIPWMANAHYPLNTEMLYIVALPVGSDALAHGFIWVSALALAFAMAAFMRRFLPQANVWLALALLAVQPLFAQVTGNAMTDFPLALDAFLCLWAFLEGRRSGRESWFWVSAVLAGLASSLKLNGPWVTLGWMILMAAHAAGQRSKLPWRLLLIAGLLAAATGSAWYLRNGWLTGNPIWPYFSEFFGLPLRDVEAGTRLRVAVTEGIPKTLANYLALPWFLLFSPMWFNHRPDFLLVPLLGLGALVGLRRLVRGGLERWVAGFSFLFGTAWFWVCQDWRYMLPVFPWMALLVAEWWRGLGEEFPAFARRPAGLLLLYALWPVTHLDVNNALFPLFAVRPMGAIQAALANVREDRRVLGRFRAGSPAAVGGAVRTPQADASSPRERYLERSLQPYPMFAHVNRTLPGSARVFLYGEVRGYYLDREFCWGDPLNPSPLDYRAAHSPRDVHRRLLSLGYTHVLTNPGIGDYHGDQDYYRRARWLMEDTLKSHATVQARINGLALYKLK